MQKAAHLRAVLVVEHRAGDVGDAAAGLHQRRRRDRAPRPDPSALGERAGPHAPFGIRIAPPRAGAGARRIDQHEVGLPCRSRAGPCRRAGYAPARCARRRARAAHGSARDGACRCRSRRSDRDCSIAAASASVLPPAPAHRSITCSPGFAPASNAASCEPSSWISIWPLRKAGSAWIAGLFASRRNDDAHARRRPARRLRRRTRRAPQRRCRASAFSVLTRRSSGAREASAAPSSARLVAERGGETTDRAIRDSRPTTCAGASSRLTAAQPRALVVAQAARARSAHHPRAWRSPRHRAHARARSMPSTIARGVSAPMIQADDALRRSAS